MSSNESQKQTNKKQNEGHHSPNVRTYLVSLVLPQLGTGLLTPAELSPQLLVHLSTAPQAAVLPEGIEFTSPGLFTVDPVCFVLYAVSLSQTPGILSNGLSSKLSQTYSQPKMPPFASTGKQEAISLQFIRVPTIRILCTLSVARLYSVFKKHYLIQEYRYQGQITLTISLHQ